MAVDMHALEAGDERSYHRAPDDCAGEKKILKTLQSRVIMAFWPDRWRTAERIEAAIVVSPDLKVIGCVYAVKADIQVENAEPWSLRHPLDYQVRFRWMGHRRCSIQLSPSDRHARECGAVSGWQQRSAYSDVRNKAGDAAPSIESAVGLEQAVDDLHLGVPLSRRTRRTARNQDGCAALPRLGLQVHDQACGSSAAAKARGAATPSHVLVKPHVRPPGSRCTFAFRKRTTVDGLSDDYQGDPLRGTRALQREAL
jgi:hypothetical protein